VVKRRNETAQDLEREETARRLIEQYRDKRVIKLSETHYQIDWAVLDPDGSLCCYAEYKFRTRKYPSTLLSAAKYAQGLFLAQPVGVPFRLFVEWPWGVHWVDMPPGLSACLGGRNDRNQSADIEPVVHIDSALFRPLTPKVR
jgi:hypothetical protein